VQAEGEAFDQELQARRKAERQQAWQEAEAAKLEEQLRKEEEAELAELECAPRVCASNIACVACLAFASERSLGTTH
jgi:adenosyl cobinamide kinase/adenosyl cobinamide phosphate guanylyltransferase